MHLYSDFAEVHDASNLLVHQTGRYVPHHLTLAGRQRLEERLNVGLRIDLCASACVPLQRNVYRVEQLLVAKRLRKKIHGSRLHGANRQLDIAVPRHEDYRQLDIQAAKSGLHIEAIHHWQPKLRNQATWPIRQAEPKQFSC
jgi:hypothetical protein